MDTLKENVEDLVDHIQDYIETQKELLVLGAQEKAAAAISQTIVYVLAGMFAFLGLAFLSIALAMWLGRLQGGSGYSFLIVGIFYAIGASIFYALRQTLLENRLNDLFLIKFMNSHE